MKQYLTRANLLIAAKIGLAVVAGVLGATGHLSHDMAGITEVLLGSLGLTGAAHAVSDVIAKGGQS